ncbi:MAG: ABC transporter permease [Clostridiaceae bacterium]|nr:ABC transporter permease [Clostridiaceae bacterium]
MKSLCKNELVKIFKRPLFLGIASLIIVLCCIYAFLHVQQNDYSEETHSNWKVELASEISRLQDEMDQPNFDRSNILGYMIDIEIKQYKLDHDIAPDDWRQLLVSQLILLRFDEESNGGQESSAAREIERIILENDFKANCDLEEKAIREEMAFYEENSYGYQNARLNIELLDLKRVYFTGTPEDAWRREILIELQSKKSALLGHEFFGANPEYHLMPNEIESLETTIQEMLYRIQHDLPKEPVNSFSGYLSAVFSVRVILTLSVVLISSLCVSNEFTYGTIQNLLSFPYRRFKVLSAKIVSILLCGIGLHVIFYISAAAAGAVAYGKYPAQAVISLNGSIFSMDFLLYFLVLCAFSLIETIAYSILSVFLSLLIKTPAISLILVTVPILISRPVLRYLSVQFRIRQLIFVPFASFDFSQFFTSDTIISGLTLSTSVIMYITSVGILLLLSFLLFAKKDY